MTTESVQLTLDGKRTDIATSTTLDKDCTCVWPDTARVHQTVGASRRGHRKKVVEKCLDCGGRVI